MSRLVTAAVLAASCALAGCGTKTVTSDYSGLASEQQRCADYWRRSGDYGRAETMDRRAMETRSASSSTEVDALTWYVLDGLLFLLLGPDPPQTQTSRQDPRPNDPRGCE